MKNIIMTIFVLTAFTILNIGCAQLSFLGQTAEQPEEGGDEKPTTEAVMETALPDKADSSAAIRQIETAVRKLTARDREGKLSLDELRRQAIAQRLNGIKITGCELAHLKALIAANRTPFVIIKPPEGNERVRAVVAYQDAEKKIKLLNPFQKGVEEMEYSAFEPAWKAAAKTPCTLLLSARSLRADTVKKMLTTYFAEDKLANLSIK